MEQAADLMVEVRRGNYVAMRVVTGKVVDGKVVVEGDPLEEGSTVTVLAPEDDDDFELTAEQEAILLKAIEEADQGDFIEGDQLLRD